jgi:hypothetical protein
LAEGFRYDDIVYLAGRFRCGGTQTSRRFWWHGAWASTGATTRSRTNWVSSSHTSRYPPPPPPLTYAVWLMALTRLQSSAICITVVSPLSEHPNCEQFLNLTGFRGDGRAVIQNVTHLANKAGPQSDGFSYRPRVKFNGFYANFRAFSQLLLAFFAIGPPNESKLSTASPEQPVEVEHQEQKKLSMSQPQSQIWRSRESL